MNQKETEMQELQARLSLKEGKYVLHITYYIYILDTYYKLYCKQQPLYQSGHQLQQQKQQQNNHRNNTDTNIYNSNDRISDTTTIITPIYQDKNSNQERN